MAYDTGDEVILVAVVGSKEGCDGQDSSSRG